MITNVDGNVTLKLEEFLKVLERASLFEQMLDESEMHDVLGNGNPHLYIPAEPVLEKYAPGIFADLTKRRRAEWEDKKARAEKGEADDK